MYHIKPFQKLQARKLKVIISPSEKGFSKLDVFNQKGEYITSIGDKRYKDYVTYVEDNGLEYANKRRDLYHKRHKKDNVEGTRGYYALNILW
jgi:hypothetical protein